MIPEMGALTLYLRRTKRRRFSGGLCGKAGVAGERRAADSEGPRSAVAATGWACGVLGLAHRLLEVRHKIRCNYFFAFNLFAILRVLSAGLSFH